MTRFKSKLHVFLAVVIAAAVIGAGYAAFLDYVLRSDLSAHSFLRGALRGTIVGAIVLVFESALTASRLGHALRRAPFLVSLLLRAFVTTLALMAAIFISRMIFSTRGHPMEQWLETGLYRDFVFVSFIAFAIHFVLQTRRIVGGKILTYFLLGRYNQPVVEHRIFMLLDIVGSTAIAQRLGETEALKLVTRFFFDIAEPIDRFGGETDIYVGDEIVVSWPLADPSRNGRCLECYKAIRSVIAANENQYVERFGETPRFRVGLHGGPIAAGECGDNKRQVVYIGDTINVTKRLQEACRDYDQELLISGDLLDNMDLPEGLCSEYVGTSVLRGRNTATRFFTICECGAMSKQRKNEPAPAA